MLLTSCGDDSNKPRRISNGQYYRHYAQEDNYRITEDHDLYYGQYFHVKDSVWTNLYDQGTTDYRFIQFIMNESHEGSEEDLREYEQEQYEQEQESRYEVY